MPINSNASRSCHALSINIRVILYQTLYVRIQIFDVFRTTPKLLSSCSTEGFRQPCGRSDAMSSDALNRVLFPSYDVVVDDTGRFTVDPDQRLQFLRHLCPRDAGVGDECEVFASAIVVDRQDAELAAGPERVRQEVQGPARSQRHWHWRSAATGALTPTPAPHRQPFLPVSDRASFRS